MGIDFIKAIVFKFIIGKIIPLMTGTTVCFFTKKKFFAQGFFCRQSGGAFQIFIVFAIPLIILRSKVLILLVITNGSKGLPYAFNDIS